MVVSVVIYLLEECWDGILAAYRAWMLLVLVEPVYPMAAVSSVSMLAGDPMWSQYDIASVLLVRLLPYLLLHQYLLQSPVSVSSQSTVA